MRVTHVITRLVVGGAQENTVSSVLGLSRIPGLDCHLVSGPTTGPEGSLESLVSRERDLLTVLPELVREVHPWKDWLALLKLARHFRETRPDLVHTHSSKAGILGRLAARRAQVPILVHHIHGPAFGPAFGRLSNLAFTAAERHTGRFTTHFLCSSQAMARIYLETGIGRPEHYTRLFSGFEVAPFERATNDLALRSQLGLSSTDFVIGQVARFVPRKGHAELLAAFQQLLPRCPEARLLWIGDGPIRAELEDTVRRHGLTDRVVFTGLVPPSEVARYFGVFDCLAHLSTFPEGLPRVLPQALAAGKPIVSFDFDGADEVCLDGRTGFLILRGDIGTAAERLGQLAADPGLRERLGSCGRELVRHEFTVEAMVERQHLLYLELAARHLKNAR